MLFFDTHCHVFSSNYSLEEMNKIFDNLKINNLIYLLNVGYDFKTNKEIIDQLSFYRPFLFGALGIHPNSNEDLNTRNLKWIEKNIFNRRIIALGEIGLDYYRSFTKKEKQKKWLLKQIELAIKYDLPVSFHVRDAFPDFFNILKKCKLKKAIIHCFTGNWEIAKKFIEMSNDFYISFSGNITYKNWKNEIEKVIKMIPLNKILLETDSPYLSPFPFRGKKNSPKNIVINLAKISEIRKININLLSYIIMKNTLKIFNVKNEFNLN